MIQFLLSLLPPYNLARVFSAYRILEDENAELREKVCELEDQLTDRVNYILFLRGAPALDVVRKDKDKPKNDTLLPPLRKSLRARRRDRTQAAIAKLMETEAGQNGDGGMAARADEFTSRISGGDAASS